MWTLWLLDSGKKWFRFIIRGWHISLSNGSGGKGWMWEGRVGCGWVGCGRGWMWAGLVGKCGLFFTFFLTSGLADQPETWVKINYILVHSQKLQAALVVKRWERFERGFGFGGCVDINPIRGAISTHRPRRMRGTWKERTACFWRTTNRIGLFAVSESSSTDTRTPSVWENRERVTRTHVI